MSELTVKQLESRVSARLLSACESKVKLEDELLRVRRERESLKPAMIAVVEWGRKRFKIGEDDGTFFSFVERKECGCVVFCYMLDPWTGENYVGHCAAHLEPDETEIVEAPASLSSVPSCAVVRTLERLARDKAIEIKQAKKFLLDLEKAVETCCT